MIEAKASQERYDLGTPLSELDGIPIAIKDNILVENMPCTASSLIMKDFISPVDATNVRKLKEKGVIVTGKVNMDEFGMGTFGRFGYN